MSAKRTTVEPGMRAVVVPTSAAPITVIVPPCGTGASVRSANVAALAQTTGTTSLQLPQRQGERVVLIPSCSGGQGGSTGVSSLPSAAFVTAPGGVPPVGTAPQSSSPPAAGLNSAQFQLTVPNGSPIRTIVVSPCEKAQPSGPAEQILSAPGNSSTVVAPAC